MEITFRTNKLRKECCEERAAVRAYGHDNARRLKTRLDDLKAAPNLEAMRNLPGRCHELTGDRKGQLTLDLKHPLRLVFAPCGESTKNKEDGGLDWQSVIAVEIIELEDTHD